MKPEAPDLSRALDRTLPLEQRQAAYREAWERWEEANAGGRHQHPGQAPHIHAGPRFHTHRPDGSLAP